jgi:hypothetical protein
MAALAAKHRHSLMPHLPAAYCACQASGPRTGFTFAMRWSLTLSPNFWKLVLGINAGRYVHALSVFMNNVERGQALRTGACLTFKFNGHRPRINNRIKV